MSSAITIKTLICKPIEHPSIRIINSNKLIFPELAKNRALKETITKNT